MTRTWDATDTVSWASSLALPQAVARATPTPAHRVVVSVCRVVSMALRAMRLAAIAESLAVVLRPAHVLGVRNNLKMVGVHAGSVAAKMVDGKPIGYRANAELVGEAMRANTAPRAVSPTANTEPAVAIPIYERRPFPAVGSERHLRPKAVSDRSGYLHIRSITDAHVIEVAG